MFLFIQIKFIISKLIGIHCAVVLDHLFSHLLNEFLVYFYYYHGVHCRVMYLVPSQRPPLPVRQSLVLAELLPQHGLRDEGQTAESLIRMHRLEQLADINDPDIFQIPYLLITTPQRFQKAIHIIIQRMSYYQPIVLYICNDRLFYGRDVLYSKSIYYVHFGLGCYLYQCSLFELRNLGFVEFGLTND